MEYTAGLFLFYIILVAKYFDKIVKTKFSSKFNSEDQTVKVDSNERDGYFLILSTKRAEFLEKEIDTMEELLPPMTHFILPGGHTTVSYCHIARCVCRRAERLAVHLDHNEPVDENAIKYLNRLSDYLFVLARKLSYDLKAAEVKWIPRK